MSADDVRAERRLPRLSLEVAMWAARSIERERTA
jgi:hypothetical protein